MKPEAQAYSAVSLITQYKSTFDDLRLSQQSVGEILNPTAQPPAQNMTPINSFSSTDGVTFWPWREEVLTVLRHSGTPQERWAEVLLQHVSAPDLNKVTTTSKDDIDCIFSDLQYHYGDPHIAIATLSRCHIALGPIPNPTLYKVAALSLVKSSPDKLCSTDQLSRHSWSTSEYLLEPILLNVG